MNRILPEEISSRILRAANYAIDKRMGVTVTVGGTIKIPAINDSIGQAHILRNIGKEPQVDKVKNPRGGCGFLSRGGCKFFESEGGYPP